MNEQEVSTTVNGDNIVINMGGKEITFKGAQKVSEKDAPAKGGETPVKKLFVGRAQKKSERKEELVRKYEALRNERLSKYQVFFFFFSFSFFFLFFFFFFFFFSFFLSLFLQISRP